MTKKSSRIKGEPPETAASPAGLSLAEFRRAREQLIERTLPGSGLAIKLRQVRLLDLALQGDIPKTLDPLVRKATTSAGIGIEDVVEMMPLINIVVKAALVDPPVADEADAKHLALDEIPVTDRFMIFGWANEGASALGPFRR